MRYDRGSWQSERGDNVVAVCAWNKISHVVAAATGLVDNWDVGVHEGVVDLARDNGAVVVGGVSLSLALLHGKDFSSGRGSLKSCLKC